MADSVKSKLDAPSRRRLSQLLDDVEPPPGPLALFIRGAAPFSPEQLDQLKREGATVRTCAGVIATIDVPLAAVDRVLQQEFVVAAQISSPLYDENTRAR